MKKHVVTNWHEHSPEAYISNGVIGLRVGKNPFQNVQGLLAGFTSVREHVHVEALSAIPTPNFTFTVRNEENKAEFLKRPIVPQILKQEYDFSNGEFTTFAKIGTVDVEYTIYCSRVRPTLMVGHLKFTGEPQKLKIRLKYAVIDKLKYTVGEGRYIGGIDSFDGKCLLKSADGSTSAGIAFNLYGASEKQKSDMLSVNTVIDVTPEGTELDLVTSYVPSVMHDEPHNQAQRMIQLASWEGLKRIREDNRKAWAKLWESRITIEGADPEWQNVIDASYFYLMSSASEFSPISVAPYGLSHADAYEGHFFWDTESFMFMTPLLCAPKVAKTMLDYRVERIPAAKNNAKLNGYSGIQFPWQSGRTGDELTVPWCTQAGEQHVNLDVALAFDGYARVTGDKEYIRECVWPVMRGVCEWIESRVEKTERGYEILHITGIDEGHDDVNNDSFTNLMAAKLLRSASEYSEMLGHGKREDWLKIAENIYVPRLSNGVLAQYDDVDESEDAVAVVLMAHFPYGYSDETDMETFKYYVYNGMKKYLHYPMQSGYLGIFPAWIGDRETALDYYEDANLTFFCEPFYACTEMGMSDSDRNEQTWRNLVTSFITARGSLLSGLLMGLPKICPWKGDIDAPIEEWLGEDIVLPAGWTKLTIGKIYLRGKAYKIIAEHGAKHAVLEELE